MATIGGGRPALAGIAERGDVLDAVDRLLQEAAEGRGGALFVEGPAGLGKTTLLGYAMSTAGSRFGIGIGRGDQVESVLPFGLICQALKQFPGAWSPASGIAADGGDVQAADISPQSRFYGILRALREAAVGPLLLALDDLHWSDPDSLTAVHLICRRLAGLPVALVATARPWPDRALASARDLAAQGLADIQRLAPLSAAAARTLLHSRVSREVPVAAVDHAVAVCAGNPLLVEQVALELSRNGRMPNGKVSFARFAGVGAAGRRYLQAASVLGTRFRITAAAEVAGLTSPEAAADIDGLFEGGLLHEVGDGWARFTHALVRQGVYDRIAPPRRRDLHAASFRALISGGAYPAEAAAHAIAADLAGDAEAVATVAQAGREALRAGAVRAARAHLDNAMRLAGQTASTEMQFDLGAALVADGAAEEAMAVYERMLQLPELTTAHRVAVLRHLGQVSFFAGQVNRSTAFYETAVDLAERDHPALAVGALLDQACHQLTVAGPRVALPWANRAMDLAMARGASQASAQATWGTIAYRSGNPDGLGAAQPPLRGWRSSPPRGRWSGTHTRILPSTTPSSPSRRSGSTTPSASSLRSSIPRNAGASRSPWCMPRSRGSTGCAVWAGWLRRTRWWIALSSFLSCYSRTGLRWPAPTGRWSGSNRDTWNRPRGIVISSRTGSTTRTACIARTG